MKCSIKKTEAPTETHEWREMNITPTNLSCTFAWITGPLPIFVATPGFCVLLSGACMLALER